jgi:drug/metabolite transporter (DMT)-like permease
VLVIVLALGSSACYGVSNFLGPQLARRHPLVTVLLLSQAAALLAATAYLVADGGKSLPSSDTWLALLAGLGNAGGLIGFYKAAELGPLSVAAPIGASGAIIPVAWGIASGDSLRSLQLAGLILAMGGALLAARRPTAGHEAHTRYPDPRASAQWAMGSAVAFGVFLTALPKASTHGRAWALFDARLAMVLLLIAWAGRRVTAVRVKRSSVTLAIPGLLLITGTLMYTTAASHGKLSLVSVLGSLFPIFTVGLGVTLLGERLSPTQAVGVLAAITGIVLIAL